MLIFQYCVTSPGMDLQNHFIIFSKAYFFFVNSEINELFVNIFNMSYISRIVKSNDSATKRCLQTKFRVANSRNEVQHFFLSSCKKNIVYIVMLFYCRKSNVIKVGVSNLNILLTLKKK